MRATACRLVKKMVVFSQKLEVEGRIGNYFQHARYKSQENSKLWGLHVLVTH